MKTKVSYVLKNGKEVEVDGFTLLQLLNNVAYSVSNELGNCERGKDEDNVSVFTISNASDWIDCAKMFFQRAQKSKSEEDSKQEVREKIIIDVNEWTRVEVNGTFDRVVNFPQGKHSYLEIKRHLQGMLTNTELSDAELAKALLGRIQLKDYRTKLQAEDNFLDHLLVLLCVVESSRQYSGMAYILMLFDLMICGGDGKTHYSFANAFVSGKGYVWEDSEHKDYGGKYPLAVNSTGSGNFAELIGMLRNTNYSTTEGTQKLISQRQHHAVAVRGMTMIVHWLNQQHNDVVDYLRSAADGYQLHHRIKDIFKQRIVVGYTSQAATLPIADLKQNQSVKLSSPALIDRDSIKLDFCLLLGHQKGGFITKTKAGFFHRVHAACKLIPEYVLESREKEVKGSEIYKTRAKFGVKTVGGVPAGFKPCPCCFKPDKPAMDAAHPVVAYSYEKSKSVLHWYDERKECWSKKPESEKRVGVFYESAAKQASKCKKCWPDEQVDSVTAGVENISGLGKKT